MTKPNILIADDDRTLRKGLVFELQDFELNIFEAETVVESLENLKSRIFNLVITDLKIPEVSDGLKILEEAKRINPHAMVMVITGYGSIELAVQAMKKGADDFITKDSNIEEIKLKIEKLLENNKLKIEHAKIIEENIRLRKELEKEYKFENLVGNSKIFREVLKTIGKVAEDGQCTVLLQGESGTGKELAAKAIHYNSPRKDKPYVVVSIAALPEKLLESELFGHIKGAFTDAIKNRDGKFKLAEGGTIFLDEIGDLSLTLQTKLLRVLQEKTFTPVGSNTTLKADVRIIAATNQDLKKMIEMKKFREDLFYRLNVVPIQLPPLRERKNDIPILINYFLEKFNKERNKKLKINKNVINAFIQYDWKGNIRELENVIEQLIVLSNKKEIEVEDLPEVFNKFKADIDISRTKIKKFSEARSKYIEDFEKNYLQNALIENDWNISKTAKKIEVSREGLHRMIKRYNLVKGNKGEFK